ncbi:hypothetical protein, partial [uncultured Xylophilus sp.]|uniref:hypothetical protein n=1 Tax=uncultured Xylophilus sp. TaxID=296832 RepID=UPI0025E87BA8
AGTAAAAGVPGGVQIVNPAPPGGAAPGTPTAAAAAAAANTGASAGARYVEACQQALERGAVNPGCQGPLYASEIARLKDEALKSQNASLLTLLGDAYQSNRSGISDVGQAYRWYLLAAVRGDPRAMQRLSDLYRNGRGAPQDNVRALGYARLAQKLALPGSPGAQQSAEAIQSLGQDMASEELVLADRFAGELEQNLRGAGAAGTAAPATPAAVPAAQPGAPLTGRLPGLGSARAGAAAPPATPVPAPSGVPALPGAATAP